MKVFFKKHWALLTELLLALLSSVPFFFGFQILASDFADFSHLWRMGPSILSYWLLTYILFFYHAVRKQEDPRKCRKGLKINAFVLGGISLTLSIWILCYIAIGIYPRDEMLNDLFPIDVLLLSIGSFLVSLALLFFVYFRATPLKEEEEREKGKIMIPSLLWKILSVLAFSLYSLIAIYELGSLILGFSFVPSSHPLFPYAIPAYIAMFFPSCLYVVREFFPLISGSKTRISLQISLLILAVLIGVLPLFMLIPAPNYVEKLFHPYYPLDFMGSLRISLYLWSIPNILAPIFFLRLLPMKVLSSKK